MATEIGKENPVVKRSEAETAVSDISQRLRFEAFSFRFFQAVWLLEQLQPRRNPVGGSAEPWDEVVRFSVYPSPSQTARESEGAGAEPPERWRSQSRLVFPASEILEIDWTTAPPRMCVNFMGLTGPKGVLPYVYSELIEERLSAPLRDYSLRDFLDIFNHRLISLFYSAWKRSRLPVDLFRYRQCFMSLAGIGTAGLERRQAVEDDTYLFYTGLFALQPRSAVSLERILEDYFQVPVEIEQFVGAWYALGPESQFRFNEFEDPNDALGVGVVVGDEVWDQQSRVTVQLGPLTMEQYQEFLPGGLGYQRLQDITRLFSRDELDFAVRLVLRKEDVPRCSLNNGVRLGWTSWFNNRPAFPRDPADALLVLQ